MIKPGVIDVIGDGSVYAVHQASLTSSATLRSLIAIGLISLSLNVVGVPVLSFSIVSSMSSGLNSTAVNFFASFAPPVISATSYKVTAKFSLADCKQFCSWSVGIIIAIGPVPEPNVAAGVLVAGSPQ